MIQMGMNWDKEAVLLSAKMEELSLAIM